MAAPWLILSLPVLATAFALAVHVSSHNNTQLELQVAADAAALAGTNAEAPAFLVNNNTLVADYLLTNSASLTLPFANVQSAAQVYAQLNPVSGNGLTLAANPTNDPSGELVIGTRSNGPTSTFVPLSVSPLPALDLYDPQFNSVVVQVQRSNVQAVSSVYLDRDVYSFQVSGSSDIPLTSVSNLPAVPIVPIGILTDYTGSPPSRHSWEYNIMSGSGQDRFGVSTTGQIAPTGQTLVTVTRGGDGIPEIEIHLSGQTDDNGQLLAISGATNQVSTALSQVTDGISGAQLAAYDPVNNQFSLYNANTNQNAVSLTQLVPQSGDLSTLQTNLNAIKGQPRVWPLFDQVTTSMSGNQVRVVGFVAARVMDVTSHTNSSGATTLHFVLQPTMLLTSTAITDYTKRQLGPRTVQQTQASSNKNSIFNPYIGRVRLVN